METFYIVVVALLFCLAVFDLVVGVSNDAVNFLNSAIGSKVAKRHVIMIVASAGILIGAITSGGMMEVARKGIFNPEHFFFDEVMVIFLAVMITDILLLDLFNTLAMPTSTTVSIVFEILGAALAISIIKVIQGNKPMNFLFNNNNPEEGIIGFMNWSNAGKIISGIVLSVIFAFTIGAIIQYFSRWLFSFEYKKRMKFVGIFWCAIAFSFMAYFLIFKGLKATYKDIKIPQTEFAQYINLNGYKTNVADLSALPKTVDVRTKSGKQIRFKMNMQDHVYSGTFGNKGFKKILKTVESNLWTYAAFFYVGMLILLFILSGLKVNILRLVVLFGTFCLAMAFAGNDLVNFIGIPVAGVQSHGLFQTALESNAGLAPNEYQMFSLKFPQETPFLYLALAGGIMILTLWFSKKSRSVTETEVNLGSQSDVNERFQPNAASRGIVKTVSKINNSLTTILPKGIKNSITQNFTPSPEMDAPDRPAFDLVRASVNLAVASVLIAIATKMKLPLSTTYVSFMVAMGTSLADRAWGRESAVYRVAGVMNVIGGWFLTAIIALTAAALFASFMYFGGMWAIFTMVIIVALVIIKSSAYHKITVARKERLRKKANIQYQNLQESLDVLTKDVSNSFSIISNSLTQSIDGVNQENKKLLKSAKTNLEQLEEEFAMVKNGLFKVIKKNKTDEVDSSKLYVLTYDLIQDIVSSLKEIVNTCSNHVMNNHKPLTDSQIKNVNQVKVEITDYLAFLKEKLEQKDFNQLEEVIAKKSNILITIDNLLSEQISGVTNKTYGFKNTSLYFNWLLETKDIVAVSARFIKLYKKVLEEKNLL